MLEFFRRYQSYFFVLITIVIVISFSFFGTFSAVNSANSIHEQVAFKAVDGTEVTRRELDEMVYFISTDAEDKLIFGGAWGPNFLNDGVLSKDFLETGLAERLTLAYKEAIAPDYETRIKKEQRYALYEHPEAKFIGVETAWAYFAPQMKRDFLTLRGSSQALSPEAFKARVNLYKAEKKLPAPMLKQILRYQQQQFSWIRPDPLLDRTELALFGYHTAEDWFGPRLVRLMAEFIINASKIAEQKGYKVSKEEVLADLMHNVQMSFQQNQKNPQLGVANSLEYFHEQLRHLGMDQTKAVKVWRQVLLFRRLFNDVGEAVWVDPLTIQPFINYANEETKGDLYQLPSPFRLGNYRALQKFTSYLVAVAPEQKDPLSLPKEFLSPKSVAKNYPALIAKPYHLELRQVNKQGLAKKVSIRQMWEWESEAVNWELMRREFPQLGKAEATADQRMAVLDHLDQTLRNRIDAFARKKIVEANPEWMVQALAEAASKKVQMAVRLSGGNPQFGLNDRRELIKLLDAAQKGGEEATDSMAQEALKKLSNFTGDEESYFSIQVLDKGEEEVLAYAEADKEGVLDQLLDEQLEIYYVKNRSSNPDPFKKAEGGWKEFATVKEEIANLYFKPLLNALRAVYTKVQPNAKAKESTGEQLASLRFYNYIDQIRRELEKGTGEETFVKGEREESALTNQWKLVKTEEQLSRSHPDAQALQEVEKFLSAPVQIYSSVQIHPNGDLNFFFVKSRGLEKRVGNNEMALGVHKEICSAAKCSYLESLLPELKQKKALTLEYMNYANGDVMGDEKN